MCAATESCIAQNPVVCCFRESKQSVGSLLIKQQDFGQSVIFFRPDLQIFTYDLSENSLPGLNVRDSKVKFTVTGLGPQSYECGP